LTGLLAGAASFATVHDHKGAYPWPRFLFCSETDSPNGVQVSLDDPIQAADPHRIKGNGNVPASDGEMSQEWLHFWLRLSTGARQQGTKDRARWKSVHTEGQQPGASRRDLGWDAERAVSWNVQMNVSARLAEVAPCG
jgi:hypothetical protein